MFLYSTQFHYNPWFLSSWIYSILIKFLNFDFKFRVYNSIKKWFRQLYSIWGIHYIILIYLCLWKYVSYHLIFIQNWNIIFQFLLFIKTNFWILNLWLIITTHIKSFNISSIFEWSHTWIIQGSWLINCLEIRLIVHSIIKFILFASACEISYIWHKLL